MPVLVWFIMWKIATVQYEVRFTVWFMLWKIAAAQYEDGCTVWFGLRRLQLDSALP